MPPPAQTTDAIWANETDADFEDTCRVARAAGFSRIHVFSYSRRRGTPAADYPDQIPPAIKERLRPIISKYVER